MECWGRRPILSFCQIISGVCCIIAGLLFEKIKDDDESGSPFVALQLLLSLVGKMLASATFQIIYLYTAEIYPTTIRYCIILSLSRNKKHKDFLWTFCLFWAVLGDSFTHARLTSKLLLQFLHLNQPVWLPVLLAVDEVTWGFRSY